MAINLLAQMLQDLDIVEIGDLGDQGDRGSASSAGQESWRSQAHAQLRSALRECLPLSDAWRRQTTLDEEEKRRAIISLWIFEIIESCWHEAAHATCAEANQHHWTVSWRHNTPWSCSEGEQLLRGWGQTTCLHHLGSSHPRELLEIATAPQQVIFTRGAHGEMSTQLSAEDIETALEMQRRLAGGSGRRPEMWKRVRSTLRELASRSGISGNEAGAWPKKKRSRQRMKTIARLALNTWPFELSEAQTRQGERDDA